MFRVYFVLETAQVELRSGRVYAFTSWAHGMRMSMTKLVEWPVGRGLHSSTFRLNVSTFCGIRWVHNYPPVY